jgi:hypothetical protein
VPDPACSFCNFGKAQQKCHKTHTGHISEGHTKPGHGVSSDGLESGTPGRPFTTKGSPSNTRYNYVSFWVDHMSTFVYITFHSSKAAKELVRSKTDCEQFAARYNVNIKNIRADNGVYAAQLFREACIQKQQNLTFCAVGAHWQNGIAERFIGTITQRARTILLHAMAKWSDVIKEDMWTFALRHAINFHNSLIRKDSEFTPYRLFTNQESPWSLRDFRIFGSPTYVLQKELQDGMSFSKWKPRAWKGVHIGHSTCHASSIPLIYNPETTHISPQFHVIYDEHFKTATGPTMDDNNQYLEKLFNTSARWLYKDPYTDNPYLFETFWHDSKDDSTTTTPKKRKAPHTKIPAPNNLRGSAIAASLPQHTTNTQDLDQRSTSHHTVDNVNQSQTSHTTTAINDGFPTDLMDQQHDTNNKACLTQFDIPDSPDLKSVLPQYDRCDRSNYYSSYKKRRGIEGTIQILVSSTAYQPNPYTLSGSDSSLSYNIFSSFIDLPVETQDPFLYSFPAIDNKTDTLTQSQMFKDQDAPKFIASQAPELKGLKDLDVFDIKPMSAKPRNARLLSSIWSYRRKRSPIGIILKYKARLCVDGSQQEFGRDFWETYAPMVSWSTIRLVLLLSTILNLKSRQVDYTQEFPQAPLEDPVYMRMPQGWYVDEFGTLKPHEDPKFHDHQHFIQLKRNLYGCKQAARNWFHHLKQGLLAEGFKQSKIDPCLFLRHDCLMVVYTDDCLIFSRDDKTIDALITSLSSIYKLEDQGTVNDYLGIRITKDNTTKTIQMVQPGLIESVLQDLNLLSDSKSKDTPASGILYPDKTGHPRTDSWNYHSVIGKLNFIAQNTRPDISFAVHQCARFSSNPTALHKLAVKCIGRYLLATKDKDLILHPTNDFKLDMFVDADFAGMWHRKYSELRDCALSRTGYIITHMGIQASNRKTTEREYIALSMATRELLPLRRLVIELHKHYLFTTPLDNPFSTTRTSTLETTAIYEDNASCIVLAYQEGTKVCTKHISLKWHHFKDHIKSGDIKVAK